MPMSDKKRWIRLAVAAGLGAAAGAWTYQIQKDKKAKNDARLAVVEAAVVRSRDYGKQKAYMKSVYKIPEKIKGLSDKRTR